ncbi:addiction module toxin RelE [Acetobacter syzygii]|uniref:addiction module toxin RelE n=1 Tax=Acetobacter syzygii TaxID=146476 RepID=UPI0039E74BB3
MHSVIETPIFTKRADALLSRDERAELIRILATNPRQGDVIPGLGGVRKLRFAASGQGKRGGYRVIWYVADADTPVLALLLYGKTEQVDLTQEQKKAILGLIDQLKMARRKRR